MNVMGPMYKFLEKQIPGGKSYTILGWTLMVGKYIKYFKIYLYCNANQIHVSLSVTL